MGETVALSVIVPTYLRYEKLLACLRSLRGNSAPGCPAFEVIVVDDGGRLPQEIESRVTGLDVRWIYLPANIGQPAAQSAGIASARGEIIALLDDDAVVGKDWVPVIVTFFKKNPGLAAVLGRIEAISTSHVLHRMRQKIYDRRHRLFTDRRFVTGLKARYSLDTDPDTALSDHVSGGNFAIRKVVLDAVGGLAADIRLGGDEWLSKRLLESGFAIGYDPHMVIYHHHNQSFRVLFRNNFHEGRDRVRIWNRENIPKLSLLRKITANLVSVPFRIRSFPEMLTADKFLLKVYFIFSGVQFFDAAGQVYQFLVGCLEPGEIDGTGRART